MHADPLPIADQPGSMLHPHDGRQAVLACDYRAVSHQPAHLRYQALDRDEQRRPAGVRVGGDQDVARFEGGIRQARITRACPSTRQKLSEPDILSISGPVEAIRDGHWQT